MEFRQSFGEWLQTYEESLDPSTVIRTQEDLVAAMGQAMLCAYKAGYDLGIRQLDLLERWADKVVKEAEGPALSRPPTSPAGMK